MPSVVEWLRSLGPMRLMAMLMGMATVVGIGMAMMGFFSKPEMSLLYGEVDHKDAAKIIAKLESMSIPFEFNDHGGVFMVPRDQVSRLRVTMASEGLPSGGSIGYEIFDKVDSFGTTTFVQDINLIRALEGELSRTIQAIDYVNNAKVHLVLPKRNLFSRDFQQPSASIFLKMKGSFRLGRGQVSAVQHLVAAAVPGLSPQNISIVDANGTLLARGGSDQGEQMLALDESRVNYEMRLGRTVESLLERSLGVGRVRAEVSAEMDYDRQTENTETFDPESQVVRSTQSTQEGQDSSEKTDSNQPVTVESSVKQDDATPGKGTQQKSSKTEEVVNYEISRVTRQRVKEGGQLKRLSVAVLVDGTYKVEGEKRTYMPRSAQEIEMIVKLVKSAIGFKGDRGDTVEVINMAFDRENIDEKSVSAGVLGLDKSDILKLAQVTALGIIGVLIMLFVVRPMIQKTNRPKDLAVSSQSNGAEAAQSGEVSLDREGVSKEESARQQASQGDSRVATELVRHVADSSPKIMATIVREWIGK